MRCLSILLSGSAVYAGYFAAFRSDDAFHGLIGRRVPDAALVPEVKLFFLASHFSQPPLLLPVPHTNPPGGCSDASGENGHSYPVKGLYANIQVLLRNGGAKRPDMKLQ